MSGSLRSRVLRVYAVGVVVALGAFTALELWHSDGVGDALTSTAIVAGLAVLLGGVLSVAVERMVTVPVAGVVEAARAFAAGDDRARAHPRGQRELRELAEAFNALADSVVQGRADLAASQELFRNVAEHTSDVLAVQSLDGSLTYASPSIQRVLQIAPDAVIGRDVIELLHPEDRARARGEVAQAVREPGVPRVVTHRVRRGDGEYVWLETSIVAVVDPTTGRRQLQTSSRDVTSRIAAENEIRTLNATLEARVRERTARLEHLNDELESFNYSVSHDLRAPLRSIDGFSKLVLSRYADSLDEQGVDYLTRIRAATQRMGALIDDLLGLSRAGRGELELQPTSLSDIAQSLASRLREAHPAREVQVVVQPDLTAPADPGLITVVLENLLANAWKFTSRTKRARIEVEGRTENGELTVLVRDNGAGFDPAYTDRLFGAFQRLHRSDEFPGTGIGLATVAKIVRRHGGRVWADGRPGQGATMSFSLPLEVLP